MHTYNKKTMFDFPRLCYGDGHARPGPFQCPAVNQLLRPILGSSVVGLVLVGRIAPGKGIDPTEPCWVGRERRFRSLILGLFNVVRGLLRYQRNVCLCCIKWSKSTAPDRRLSCPFKNLVKNWSPSRPLVHELRQTQ